MQWNDVCVSVCLCARACVHVCFCARVHVRHCAWHPAGADESWFPADGESPPSRAIVPAFLVDVYEVSNDRFAAFAATGYRTAAETFGWSFVHEMGLSPAMSANITQAVAGSPWWLPV